jgi:4-amino-4-deoxy-L-arabinose transferase-like glycosyltransferase
VSARRHAGDARRPAAGLGLALVCLVAWLPGIAALPPVDRDESRFLLAARTMAASGDWTVPRLDDRPRLEKPPLATWLQAATIVVATGGRPEHDAPWMGRLPSLLAALATVLVLWRVGGRLVDPRAAWLAALLLGLSPLVVSQTHQARADLLLLLPSTVCLLALARVWRSARHDRRPPAGVVLTFWLALAAAVLAKGPITPWIVAATVLGLAVRAPAGERWRWLARLHPAAGLAAIATAVAALAWEQSRAVGISALTATAYRETVGRILGGIDGHFAPPGLHALLAPALLWPGSLGLLGALAWSWRKARPRGARGASPSCRFLLAWALPAWIGFELAATKLPHYPLPLHVPLLLLSARWLLRQAARPPVAWPAWLRWPVAAWALLPALAVPAGAAALVGLATGSRLFATGVALAVLTLLAVAAARVRCQPISGLSWALAGWLLAAATLGFALPRWSAPWTAVRLAAAVAAADPSGKLPLADAAWGEASLPLLARRPVVRLNTEAVDGWLAAHPGGLAIVSAPHSGRALLLARVSGIDLVHGRWVELALVSSPSLSSPPSAPP